MNLSQKPPRNLPFIQQLTLIFGGIMQQAFGWGFFIMGSLITGIFGYLAEPIIQPSTEKWETVQGVVKDVQATYSRENKVTIYEINSIYMYKGLSYQNISYVKGNRISIGQNLSIRVNPDKPEQSRAEGLRTHPFSGFISFVSFPFLLIGLVMVVISVKKNLKARNMLLYGELTRGTLKEKRNTGSSITINNVRYPIYHYIFEFEYMGKKYEAHGRTHKGWLVEDEAQEKILFDPVNPTQNVIYDAMATIPKMDSQGNIIIANRLYANLILPTIGILLFAFLVIPVLMYQLGIS